MATTVPVISGRMGTTQFYEAKMTARELVAAARPAREMDDWANFSIEERLQRELNDKRVHDEIAPYLARSADRFFSSIVVLVYNAEVTYEALDEVVTKVPAAYRSIARDIGFLTINGGELVVLDGQHRMAALREVIQSAGTQGEYAREVPTDELSVIFVPYVDSEHTRRIFNKINRNAKPTSRGDNIITSEDDGYAILTRWLLREGEPLGHKDSKGDLIVNWKSNTLADRSTQFTTISAVYETVQTVLAHYGMHDEFNEKKNVVRPKEERLDEAYGHVKEWWLAVLDGIEAFREALANPAEIPAMRKDGEPTSLLLKPATHIVFFRGLARAVDLGLSLEEAISRSNKIDWNLTADQWRHVLIAPNNRIIARNENYEVTADLIAYLVAADKMTAEAQEAVRQRVAKARGVDENERVDEADESEGGEDEYKIYNLPTPVTG
ncbi:DNA sulfur modification protein DndB [Nakamurella panacisegetis]|uniref:DNA sulfur modification protein DndB n=1 Tax=Nakamurella panacisegetis TaxID=1090615 RepID=A0A1H0IU68_9ACTN|nr:DNA sulfur modification protein DndB [Nakamurella panacisegetis]SDO35026.1 DNA sulfur modification protein DndB [Nakamurella panacisegetis]